MKAAVLVEPGVIACEEVADPEPREDEVVVQVAYCGICGSDIPRVLMGAAHSYPLILGHEFSGTVISMGRNVDPSLAGARVAGVPLVPCGQCSDCAAGNFSLCKHYSFIGSRRPGAFAERVAVPEQNVVVLPNEVSYEEGALFEPATVARHAMLIAGFQPNSSAVVMGCGTIGILLAQMLQNAGACRVVGLVRRESRIGVARAAGLEELANTSVPGWEEKLLETLPGNGFDFVFDTSGNAISMVDSYTLAANKGTVCMVGTPKNDIGFTVDQWECLNRRELTICGTWMSYSAPFPGAEWRYTSRSFGDGTLRLVPEMIDAVYTLDDVAEAFERFKEGKVSGKVLVRCSEMGK